jgi:hypothetical protein
MRPVRFLLTAAVTLLASTLAPPAGAAEIDKGDKVWSKNVETALLAEPSPLAATQGTVGFAEKLSVKEIQGKWLRVKGDDAKGDEVEGWVFSGNVAAEKPKLPPAAGFTTVEASETNTVAAARPLTPAAEQYAQNQGAGNAQADVTWLDTESALVTQQDLTAYMAENSKGEYQE